MQCPACGKEVGSGAVICGACDYILDTSFLGDDITDNRTAATKPPEGFGGDAVILGDVTNDYAEVFNEETGSYLTAATDAAARPLRAAPVYVDAGTAQLTAPGAILGRREVPAPPLTPFEEHVLAFFDGERTVQEVEEQSGLSVEDVRIAICMLHEKGLVGVRAQAYDDADETEMEAKLPAAILAAQAGAAGSASGDEDEVSETRTLRDATKDRPPPVPAGPPSAPHIADDEPATIQTPRLRTDAEPRTKAARPAAEGESASAAPKRGGVSAADRVKARGVFGLAQKDIQEGRLARARMYAKLALSLDPGERKYQDLLENWDQAVAAAAASSSSDNRTTPPAGADAEGVSDDVRLFRQAEAAERAGDFRKAVSLLREAIQKNPNEGALHNRLGVVLATRLKDFTGGMSALFSAAELEPDNATFKHNLAKVLAAAEGKRSVANMDIDELLTGTGEFDAKKAEAVGKVKKSPFAAFKKKLY